VKIPNHTVSVRLNSSDYRFMDIFVAVTVKQYESAAAKQSPRPFCNQDTTDNPHNRIEKHPSEIFTRYKGDYCKNRSQCVRNHV